MAEGLKEKIYAENTRGWVTAQSPFNQDPKSAALVQNAYQKQDGTVEKRQGSSEVLGTDLSPADPIQNIVPYVNVDGEMEWIFQYQNEWHRIESGSNTKLGSGHSNATGKWDWTLFNGRLIMGSKNTPPKKYFYTKRPTKPTTDQTASGSLSARTYWVRVSYKNSNGETIASQNKKQDVDANNVLTVTSPPDADGVDQWVVYVSETEGEENQQDTLNIGNDFTESDSGINDTGSADYNTSNEAWTFTDLGGSTPPDEEPPKAGLWHTHNRRVFAADILEDSMEVHYSARDGEDSWGNQGTADGNGIIELDLQLGRGDFIRGMESAQNKIIFFFKNAIIAYDFGLNAQSLFVSQIMKGIGLVAREAVESVGGDVFWLSKNGLQSIAQEFGQDNFGFDDEMPSKPINNRLQDDTRDMINKGLHDETILTFFHRENWLVLSMPNEVSSGSVTAATQYVFDLDHSRWYKFEGLLPRSMAVDIDGTWYAGSDGNVLEFYDGSYSDQGSGYDMVYVTPWLYLGSPSQNLHYREFLAPFQSEDTSDVVVQFEYDFGEHSSANKTYTLGTGSKWDEGLWDTAKWSSGGSSLVNDTIGGRGKSIKVTFRHSAQTRVEIPWFGFLYKPGSWKD